jgi:hypothetical protein
MNATYTNFAYVLYALAAQTEFSYFYDYYEAYSLIDDSPLPISLAPPQIQSVIIKYAYEILSNNAYNRSNTKAPDGYGNATIAKLITDAGYPSLAKFNNSILGNMLLLDFLTCVTSDIQFVWPGSNLTENTTGVIDCAPVLPLTVREFTDISSSVIHANYLSKKGIPSTITENFASSLAVLSSSPDSAKIGTIQKAQKVIVKFTYSVLVFAPRDFNTTVGSLIQLVNATLSSTITSSLLNMLVTDFFACLTEVAPWSAYNSTAKIRS